MPTTLRLLSERSGVRISSGARSEVALYPSPDGASVANSSAKSLKTVALFVAAVISLEATTDYQRKDAPAGLVECWNPDTALITEQVGECK